MQLQSFDLPKLGEKIELYTADSGVRIALCRKPGFSTSAGYFGVRFGSTDTRFENPQGQTIEVPDGSAHFLEHKLFEGREEKVFDRFSRIGARFNGGTGFRTTTYYFTSASRFEDGLEILLDFVQHPLITEERVEKEKGIIEQEVRMYEDDPGFRGTFLLHRALYHDHPIRIAPGGTVESVRATTAADLQACYDAFYRPQNLILSLSGDLDVEPLLKWLDQRLDPPNPGQSRALYPEEPKAPAERYLEESFAVSRPHVWIGWRDDAGPGLGRGMLQRRLLSHLAVTLAMDLSSRHHEDLYQRGVIDDAFAAYYRCDLDYGYAVVSGLSDHPETFVREVRASLARYTSEGPQREDFERVVKAARGSLVSALQTPDSLASSVLHSLLDGQDPLSTLEVLEGITLEQVEARAHELFRDEQSAVALLKPA